MQIAQFPRVTIILRNVPRRVADTVVGTIADSELDLAVEITRNSANFDDVARYVRENPNVAIGAGTVLTDDDAHRAVDAGCQFALSPVGLPASAVDICHTAGLLVVPGAYTPTEIYRAAEGGADIVKLFPVRDLSAQYVRDIKAPLGEVPVMGVGGVALADIPTLFAQGIDYVGIGAGIFGPDLDAETDAGIEKTLRKAVDAGHSE